MKRGFSLIELIFAIALLCLLVVFTLPSLSSTKLHIHKINDKSLEMMEAVNVMEASLARSEHESKRFRAEVTQINEKLELVEVIDNDSQRTVLQCYRPQKGFYAD